jgi:hypothetical protein
MKKPKRWIYMIGDLGAVRMNTEQLIPMMEGHGFRRCSYPDYLAKKREFEGGQEIEIDGQHQPITIQEEIGRR